MAVLNLQVILVLGLYLQLSQCVQDVRVTSPAGTFQGAILESRRGRTIYAFTGIRYAEPPVGQLRFQPPRLISRYDDLVDATTDGPSCHQPGQFFGVPDEDCLRINVYSNDISGNTTRPVLVYIHPGGFYSVSGQSSLNGPEYLLDHDIVLVTINYRLGSLGFISTGDELAPGNNGFKDQVAALRWLQQNIASFGGDPDKVTISGYSAGAISVTLHMLSPMSRGLFHQVISMSGTSTAQWEIGPHQFHLAQRQADLVGCPSDSSQAIMDCLQTANATQIGNSLSGFFEFAGQDPTLIWTPVVEPDFGQERFLTDQPVTLIQEKNFYDVPLIVGLTELEFAGLAFQILQNSTNAREMEENWYEVAPISFQYERNTSASYEASTKLRDFYLRNRSLTTYTNETAFALGQIYGEGLISFGVYRFANLMAKYSDYPVYQYKFNFTGNESHVYYPGTNTPIGAVHHDDLIYLFEGNIFTDIGLDSPYSFIVDRLTTMWTNFVIYGDPNKRDGQTALDNLTWPTFDLENKNYLQINSEFQVLSNMYGDRFSLWDSLFPIDY